MNFSHHQKIFIVLAVLIVLTGGSVWWIRRQARQTVAEEHLKAEQSGKIDVASSPVTAPNMDGITLRLDTGDTRAMVRFQNSYFAATAGGLLRFDDSGRTVKHFTTGDGLPDNDLTALAVFRDRLFIGTRAAGLVEFDGAKFVQHSFRKPKAVDVRALAVSPGYLLVGTLDGGLIDYDGATFASRFQPDKGPKIEGVTAILADGAKLLIGTQLKGLFVWEAGELRAFSESNGLPAPHVTSIVKQNADIVVATDAGVVRFTGSGFEPVSNQPNVTSLVELQGRLWGGLVTGGFVQITKTPGQTAKPSRNLFGDTASTGGNFPAHTVLTAIADDLFALTEAGIFKLKVRPNVASFDRERWGFVLDDDKGLTAGHVTSLAFDRQGRLWVGLFERGIDILDPTTGERLQHLRDDAVREINFLSENSGRMLAATSAGLVVYDATMRAKRYDEKSGNLIGNNVAQALVVPDFKLPVGASTAEPPIVLATARGLTVMQSGISRSINAFHGLASNYLYCLEPAAGKLYVGSLGGLMELDGLRVVRTWKADNSRLSANWITALSAIDGGVYVGTYGGGVNALLPTGEIVRFEETAGLEVNQNAMTTDGEFLYVGTLDRGLLLFDLKNRKWSNWRTGLSSPNVTSVVVRDNILYCGTAGGVTQIDLKRFK